jgi:Icc-related predicted phosphoesterase
MPLFRNRDDDGAPKRLFFVTDLHGSSKAWGKMLSAASVYRVDALICGGDVAGKRLFPIVDRGGGRYVAEINGRSTEFEGEGGVAEAQKRIEDVGGYPNVMRPDEAEALERDEKAMEKMFVQCVRDRLERWISVAEDRLAGTNVKCYITGGNDDEEAMLEPLFERSLEHVVPSENTVVDVLGHPMISLGWSNHTPWATPRETTEDRLAEMIDASASKLDDFQNAIFNLHVPPKDSTLDACPKLDTSQWPPVPVMSGGQIEMFGAGSSAVAEAIERYQPLLSLHGHIHEATAVKKIGRTTCINPGSEYHEGGLLGVIVVLRPTKVVDYQLTHG